MKWIVLTASAAFWLAMTAVWSSAGWSPASLRQTAQVADAAGPAFDAEEVAEHDGAASCWMIIDGAVYDLTAYIEVHPANPKTILKYCGQDGSRGFATKDRNRPHSAEARKLLEKYRIGALLGD